MRRSLAILILAISCPSDGACQLKFLVSSNYTALLEKLPYKPPQPIAREIRYMYITGIQLKNGQGKLKPVVTTNEPKGYIRWTTEGTDWAAVHRLSTQYLDAEGKALTKSGQDFINKYSTSWSPQQMESYMAAHRAIDGTVANLQAYTAAMGALEAIGRALIRKEIESVVEWTEQNSGAIGKEAPAGSILHLEVLWVTKGQSWKKHSENDVSVIATLETADGRMMTSEQAMKKWVDTSKKTMSQPDAVPMYGPTVPAEKTKLLSPLWEKHGILPLHALMINAAIEDLTLRMQALTGK